MRMTPSKTLTLRQGQANLARQRQRPAPASLLGPVRVGTCRVFTAEPRSGRLDGRHLELERHLLADEHTTGLQRRVPLDVEVLAVDRDRAFEAHPDVAERVGRHAFIGEVDADRLGDVLDGQVTGEPVGRLVQLLDAGGDEGDLRILLDVQEVVGAQVFVTLLVARVDAGGLDAYRRRGLRRVLTVEIQVAFEVVEATTNLGDHRVPGDEPDPRVRGVEGVVAGQRARVGCGRHT